MTNSQGSFDIVRDASIRWRPAGGAATAMGQDEAGAVRLSLRILATTDLHARLSPEDDYADTARPATGLAQAAASLRRLRAETTGATLLVDNGDLLQGTFLADWLADTDGAPHPILAAMGALGYDAAAPGNHDFDHGIARLRAAIDAAAFPFVCGNLRDRATGQPWLAPWVIVDREAGPDVPPLRIGVTGFVPPETGHWTRRALGTALQVEDMASAALREVPRLRAAGADLVVALCHAGLPTPAVPGSGGLGLALVPGIDALILGHTHAIFPDPDLAAETPETDLVQHGEGRVGPCPAVQPGAYGSHVGVIDLDLGREGGEWRVLSHRSRVVPVTPDTAPDPDTVAAAAPVAARFRAAGDTPIGLTRVRLSTQFARVAKTAWHDSMSDAIRAEAVRILGLPSRPVLVALAPFRAGGGGGPGHFVNLAPGPITLRQAAALYEYPNELRILALSGADVAAWLEQSALAFAAVTPGTTEQPLLRPGAAAYNFDMIDGAAYEIDPTRPPGSRVSGLRVGGRPLGPEDGVLVVTHGHRVGGGGGFAAARGSALIAAGDRPVQAVVLDHLRAAPVDPAPRPRWRFASHPGTAAWFDGPPDADPATVPDRSIRALDLQPSGFRRFRLSF